MLAQIPVPQNANSSETTDYLMPYGILRRACAYRKPHPSVMPRWNRLSWRDDRAVLLRSGLLASSFRSKLRLEAENAALRHQLIVLMRRPCGPVRLTNHDRW